MALRIGYDTCSAAFHDARRRFQRSPRMPCPATGALSALDPPPQAPTRTCLQWVQTMNLTPVIATPASPAERRAPLCVSSGRRGALAGRGARPSRGPSRSRPCAAPRTRSVEPGNILRPRRAPAAVVLAVGALTLLHAPVPAAAQTATEPAAITNLSATAGNGRVTLRWRVPDNGGSPNGRPRRGRLPIGHDAARPGNKRGRRGRRDTAGAH